MDNIQFLRTLCLSHSQVADASKKIIYLCSKHKLAINDHSIMLYVFQFIKEAKSQIKTTSYAPLLSGPAQGSASFD
jgi:hypothetical protein